LSEALAVCCALRAVLLAFHSKASPQRASISRPWLMLEQPLAAEP
jgi:hypothetical protein